MLLRISICFLLIVTKSYAAGNLIVIGASYGRAVSIITPNDILPTVKVGEENGLFSLFPNETLQPFNPPKCLAPDTGLGRRDNHLHLLCI